MDSNTNNHVVVSIGLCNSPAQAAADSKDAACAKVIPGDGGSSHPLARHLLKTAVNGFNGGAYIALGAYFALSVGESLAPFVFPTGLAAIVLCGAELVTSNLGTVVGAWASNRFRGRHALPVANLAAVYIANASGAIAVAYLVAATSTIDENIVVAIATKKIQIPLAQCIARAVVCNWLVSLAVHMTFAARDVAGKLFALFFPVAAFVAVGAEHCVANMFYLPLALAAADAAPFTAWEALYRNILPVTLGNALGSLMVSLVYAARDADM